MIGVATILERQWKVWTGKTVTGVPGKLWTAEWQLIWGAEMVDEWARRGMIANDFFCKGDPDWQLESACRYRFDSRAQDQSNIDTFYSDPLCSVR